MKKLDAYLRLHLSFIVLWVVLLIIILLTLNWMDFADTVPVEVAQAQVESVQKVRHVPQVQEVTEYVTVNILPVTDDEIKLMAMIVHAEAEGESFKGRMLVAKTVLNRVEFGRFFGSTVSEVIFKPGQFDGINRKCFKNGEYTSSDIDAVLAALDEQKYSDVLFFCNPSTATDQEYVSVMLSNLVVAEGNHIFSR